MKDYQIIGERISVSGYELFRPDYFNDGLSFGTFFKDERAFNEDPDSICYIPESHFEDEEPVIVNGKKYYLAAGYTRRQLEEIIDGSEDDEGEPIDICYFFQSLTWMSPDTRLNEMTY